MARALLVIVVVAAVALSVGWGVGGPDVLGLPAPVVLAILALAVNWVAFVPAYLGRTERFYDLTGSVTYLAVVTTALAVAWHAGTLSAVSVGAAVAVVVWAVRLGTFLARRIHRAGKDGRFDAIKHSAPRFAVAWTLQGLWVFLTSLAATTLILVGPEATLSTALGALLWVAGFALEVVADRQKSSFNADPANRGRWIDTGLWAWSRHPNYFGEIVLWTGLWVAGLTTWSGGQWLTVLSPLFVVLLLTRVSGIPLLERRADERWGDDPGYRAYKERTPVLVPRPPG